MLVSDADASAAPRKKRRRAKSGKTKVTRRHVNEWARIRTEYETTDTSITELCQRFNIASRTSLIRVRDREGWTRDIKSIAANIVTDDILSENARTAAEQGPIEGDILRPDSVDPEAMGPMLTNYGMPGGNHRAQARVLADVQRKQVRQEQDIAELGMLISAKVLRALDTILTDDDPAKVTDAADRLGKISKNQESFSSLLRASVGAFKDAVALRRRAVGLEAPTVPKGTAMLPAQSSEIPDEIARVLPRLDIDSLEKLREVSEKLERMRTIEG